MRRIETIIREYKAPEKEKKSLAGTIRDMNKKPKVSEPDEKNEPISLTNKDKIKLTGEKEAVSQAHLHVESKKNVAPDIVSAHRSMPHNSIMTYQNSSIYTHDLPPMGKNIHGRHLRNAKDLAKRLSLQVHSTPRPHGNGSSIKTTRITIKGNHRNVELYQQHMAKIYSGASKSTNNK